MTEPLTVLSSAVVGAFIAGLVGWMNQRWRWRRDFEIRWDADRRRVYATFLTLSTIYSDAIRDLGLAIRTNDAGQVSQRQQLVEQARREMLPPLFELRLLAHERLVVAADAVKDALDERRDAVKAGTSDPDGWGDTWIPLRNAVIVAARTELRESPLHMYA